MIIRKKRKNIFTDLFALLEPVSKRILVCGSIVTSLAYLDVLIILFLKDYIFPDLQTAIFWGEQFLTLGKELLGAFYVPVLLFELLLCMLGLKKRMKEK